MRSQHALCVATFLALLSGCEDGAHHACEVIVHQHVDRVRAIVDEDLQRGLTGVTAAAALVAPGFATEDATIRERDFRYAISHRIREPPRGIPELMISPISFVAVVGADGHVICRDWDPADHGGEADPMRGLDVGALFPHVHAALTDGTASYQLVEFQPRPPPPPAPGTDPVDAGPPPAASVTVLYASPARVDGHVVGAVIAGTPLQSTARRLTLQIRAESEMNTGAIVWVYLFRGDAIYHVDTPSTLDTLVPDGPMRTAGFAHSAGGFCGEQNQFGRWYCYGVIHLPQIGPDVGAIIYRSDPVN
jgi:hypothetical protein